MAVVMIGIDPRKGSHAAVALAPDETRLGQIRVRASAAQVENLWSWAASWTERTWAIEGATGLGRLLAQQLLAAGEQVLDVQPKLAARVRLLNTGTVNKNDPNDARSVAVAAMRSPNIRAVAVEDHASVMKLWVRRHRDLSRTRNRIVCRLHAFLCDLVAGGFPKQISAIQAAAVLDGSTRSTLSAKHGSSSRTSCLLTCDASTNSVARPSAASRASSPPPAPPSAKSMVQARP